MIISRTPFRISFFGGGTDFPEFFGEHGGAVLAGAINKFCYITVHRLPPFFKYRFKANYARMEMVQNVRDFEHPLVRECMRRFPTRECMEVAHVADLPGRTGLGSSSSFTVGLLHALHAYHRHRATPEQLAREAVDVERRKVGDPGGWQDQYVAAYGGFLRLDFSGRNRVAVTRLSVPRSRIAELEKHLLLFYMGFEQTAQHILEKQRKRARKNEAALREMRQMVDEAERIMQGHGSLRPFGELLHDAWLRKQSLANGITTTEIDRAYAAARRAGALGGKILGAGGRGFLLLFAKPARHPAIRRALRGLKEVDFTFTPEGSRIIFTAEE